MQRAEFGKLANDPPDHVVALRVRSIAHLPGRMVAISTGPREAERTPAGLLQGALRPPLFEEMERCLTHGAF
jgi:hypothetical protein